MLTLVMVVEWGTAHKTVPHSTALSLMLPSILVLVCSLGKRKSTVRNVFVNISLIKPTVQFDLGFTVTTPQVSGQHIWLTGSIYSCAKREA